MRRVYLVGEDNPHTPDPRLALHPLPPHRAGGRLAAILGLTVRDYLRTFRRVNLFEGRSPEKARALARRISASGAPCVLLGRRVAAAFGLADAPFFELRGLFLLLPHPSGRCHVWNDHSCRVAARSSFARMLVAAEAKEEGCHQDERRAAAPRARRASSTRPT